METTSEKNLDISNGHALKKIISFAVPLMITGVLQLLFNAADMIVVGKIAGKSSLAAVGATASLINLIVNLFMGFSVGVSYVISKHYGANESDKVEKAVHTAMLMSFIIGVIVTVIGYVFAKPLLILMDTPSSIIDKSVDYLHVYFLGMIPFMVYNYGAAILRAVGDTKRPLLFLTIAGIFNVLLNIVFVKFCNMDVVGVALGTILSQCVSAALVVILLCKIKGAIKLNFKKLSIDGKELKDIIIIGLPAGLQSVIFALSNMIIQSSVNSFNNEDVVAGHTVSSNIEGFIYTCMNSVYQSILTFMGYHFGAKKFSQINKILFLCVGIVAVVGFGFGLIVLCLEKPLYSIYTSSPEVIKYAMIKGKLILPIYFTCGIMEVLAGSIRGLGKSTLPMLVTIFGACGIRILWIFTVFANNHTLNTLYVCYPISWVITSLIHVVCFIVIRRKLPKTDITLIEETESKQSEELKSVI